ncbi:unnamed protein product [Lymnaea stagnalis]|uniref:RING-type domain-containing protein n=1 Tax=Lymnaea stagnalis TaxID=6523 RepID=A0AAV2HQV4_LYMST
MLGQCDKNQLAGCLSERSAMSMMSDSATQKMKDTCCTRMTNCAWGNKCTGTDCTKHMNCESELTEKKRTKDRPGHQDESSFEEIWKCIEQKPSIPRADSSLRNPIANMLLTSTLSQGSSNDNPPSQASSSHTPLQHPTNISGISWGNFERETMRVASFSRYPIRSLKSASVLANSGFIYVGEGRSDKVICYFCNAVKENWKPEEDVETVHKQLSPQCPMVTITESNNTATLSTVEGATSVEDYSYSSETNSDQAITVSASGYDNRQQPRARPSSINAQQLNWLDSNRRSQPQTSQPPRNTLSSVAPQTNPLPSQNGSTDHQSLHPNINSQIYSIPRVPLSVPAVNPTIQPANHTTTPLVRDLNLQDLGIFYERPKKPEYAILTKRLETFQGWPLESAVTKENVAKAGLYYEGYGDSGRCFFCGGGLRKWEQGDDPFVEHARWYPKCGYIRQYKGQAFVDIVQIIKNDPPDRKTITLAQVVEEMDKLGVTESNAFEEDPVEHDAAVKSLLDEIQSPNSTLTYTREEVIQAAQILRNQSIALSSDLILSQLTQKHDATDGSSGATAGARATSGASNTDTIEELKDQNSTLRNNLICKICMDKEVKIVFLPCGHLVSCQECAVAFHDCPICRSHIRAYVRANIR